MMEEDRLPMATEEKDLSGSFGCWLVQAVLVALGIEEWRRGDLLLLSAEEAQSEF